MDFKFIDYIPLLAMVVNKQSGDIKYVNSKFIHELGEKNSSTNVFNLFSLKNKNIRLEGEYQDIKLFIEKNTILIGTLKVQSLDENNCLITFNEDYSNHISRYKEIFEKASDGIIVVNNKLNVLDVNRAFSDIVEIPREELINKNSFSLAYKYADKSTVKSLVSAIQGVLKGNRIQKMDLEYRGKTLSISMTTPKDSPFYIGMIRDITGRVKAQKEIKISEEKFRFLSKSTFEGIIVHDKGIVLDINDAFSRITGYTKKEGIGKNVLDFIPSIKDRAKVLMKMAQKKASPYVINVINKNGTHMKVELQAKNVYHKGKKVRIAAVRDVTEREKLQSKLEDSEKRYRSVFENTGAASCIIDVDGTISLANSRFAKLSGYSREEIQNKKTWMEFADPDDLKRMQEQHNLRRTKKGKAQTQYEFTFIDRFENRKNILLFIDLIEETNQSVASLLDITYLKETEKKLRVTNQQLIEAKEKAEESDQLKSAFLANMSHEIRTPMNGILGFASLLEEPDITLIEQKKYVEVIKRSGHRMLETVNDLIDISKIETGQVQVHISEVNINKEIEALYLFFKPEARHKGINLIWDRKIAPNEETIYTDDQKLNSILTNLIKNAIKYSDNGQIEIKAEIKNKNIYFNVIDTGIGIPQKRLTAIFNRFEQADFTDSRAFDGSGLGLTISKAYVEMLGGKIGCNSTEGKGSDFYFHLPLTAEQFTKI